MKNSSIMAMKTCIQILYILFFLLMVSGVNAQTNDKGNLGNEDVTIVKEYQPVLNDAFKMNILPAGDTSSASPAQLQYKIEPLQMNSVFNLTPIKPVKIKDDVIKKLYRGFAKAGYGNYNTPLLELSYNSIRSKLFDAGVHAKHLSSTGSINDYGDPSFSKSEFGANGKRYFEKNAVSADIAFDRNVSHFYGYNSPPEMFTKSETKHLMNFTSGNFAFYSTSSDKDKLAYHAGFDFKGFSDNLQSNESTIGFSAGGGKRYNDSYISGEMELDATNISQPLQDNARTVFRLMPRYAFKKDKYFLTAGVNIAYESGDAIDSKLHLYPHLEASFQLLPDEVSVYGKLSGNLKTNTLVEYSKENQFLNNSTLMLNTNTNVNFSTGVNARLSKELIAVAGLTFTRTRDMPYFFNVVKNNDPVKYTVVYDDVNMLNLHFEMNYVQETKLGIGLRADYYSYNTDSLEKPLFEPTFRIGLNGNYAIADKIFLKAELYYNAPTYAYDYTPGSSHYQRLRAYTDLNIGVDYHYSKILTAFVQLNNVGMQQYFRWYNYPSYRLNMMVGATYSFW